MSLWDDVKKNLVSLYGTAAEKTNELAKVGSRRYDIFGLSREIERQFSEIGSHVYDAAQEGRTDLTGDEVLAGLVEQVRKLEGELAAKKQEIEEIRAEARAAAAAEAASEAEAGADFVNEEQPDDVAQAAAEADPTRAVEDGEWTEVPPTAAEPTAPAADVTPPPPTGAVAPDDDDDGPKERP